MKILDRFFILLLALVVVALSVGLTGLYFDLFSNYQVSNLLSNVRGEVELLIIAIISFLIAARVIQLSFMRKKRDRQTTIGEGKLGTVKITLDAINKFAKEVVNEEADATNIKSKVKVKEEGLDIILNLSVFNQVKVPSLAKNLQQKVKSRIEEALGAKVAQVEVLVKGIERKKEEGRKLRLD